MKVGKKANIFNKVAIRTPKRNAFDLSHERIFSMNMGEATPIMCEEVYPNETWYVGGKTLVRTAPLARPMMSTVVIKKQHYFIRTQILWANFNLWISGGDKFNPDAAVPVFPYIVVPPGGFPVGSIMDYLGFPTGVGDGSKVSAVKLAAYIRTMQEYFFDENLMNTNLIMLTDGDNTDQFKNFQYPDAGNKVDLLTSPPLHVCWEKDYFTACLPEPQKGPEVTIPLGTEAPVELYPGTGVAGTWDLVGTGDHDAGGMDANAAGQTEIDAAGPYNWNPNGTLFANLSAATAATINSLRLAYSVQRLYERLARAGSRMPEFLRAVWGAKPRNLELDRPDYFGGVREYLSVSEVLQQSQTTTGDDASPQGNMTGHGVALVGGNVATYHTNDYGTVLSLMWVKPKTMYMQGVRKSDLEINNRFEKFFPDLAHIGEQPVLNAEIYFQNDDDVNAETFGYMPYGTHLRYVPDTVHGEFRTTQKDWTMVREFENLPALNQEFVVCEPTRRVFIDTSENTDTLYVQHFNNVTAKRCVPLFGTPNP